MSAGDLFSVKDEGALAICVLAGVAALFYGFSLRSKGKPWKMMPGRLPLLGHMHKVTGVTRIYADIERWCDEYGHENGTFTIDLGGPKFIVVCRQDRLNEILKYRVQGKMERERTVNEVVSSVGGNGVFAATGETWLTERKVVSATLNHAGVTDYLESFKIFSKKLIEKWEKSKGQEINVEPDLTYMSADIISVVGLGKKMELLEKEKSSQFARDIMLVMKSLTERSVSPVWFWRIPFVGQYLDGVGWSVDRLKHWVSGLVKEAQQLANVNTRNASGSSDDGDDDASKKKTFLSKILELSSDSQMKISKDRLGGNVMVLFLAGTDTTSRALAVGLYRIARDSRLQDKLRTEANQVKKDLDSLTLDETMNLFPRTKSFLHEIHRHHNLPFLFVQSNVDIPYCGDTIPAGSKIMLMGHYISTNRIEPSDKVKIGPKGELPHEFCAERYLEKDEKGNLTCPNPNTMNGAFGAFGFGVRACPGRTYSEALSFLVLARLLKTFEKVELACPETDDLELKVALMPTVEIKLKFTSKK